MVQIRLLKGFTPALLERPNPAVEGTACKLRLQVPSALRAPAAPHLERYPHIHAARSPGWLPFGMPEAGGAKRGGVGMWVTCCLLGCSSPPNVIS